MKSRDFAVLAAALIGSTAFAQRADVLVRPETGEVITLDGAAQVSHIEPRIPLDPPKPDDPIPESATAVMTISSPGSYFLTGNLNGGSGVCGIDIQSSNVTLDLSGYSLVGLAGSLDALTSSTGGTNIVIANGTIRGWGGDGVDGRKINSCQVANILVANCGGDGIVISRGLIKNCQARLCDGTGISVVNGKGGIAECRAEECGGHGILSGDMAAVADCSSTGNALDGIRVGRGSTVEGCVGAQNGRDGISTLNHGTVRGCTVFNNTRDGIRGGNRTTVSGCTANTNGACGIFVTDSAVIESCNASFNGDAGIQASAGVISGCDASNNIAGGITVTNEGNISACTARWNGGNGIAGGNSMQVRGCLSAHNTTTGIEIIGVGSLIEGCNVVQNANYGIQIALDSTACNNTLNDDELRVTGGENLIDANHIADGTMLIEGNGNIITRNTADHYTITGTSNKVGTIRTDPSTAGPWDNLEF